ncbi:murein L,D-transpeptidase family protein [Chloracidobacterium thermophilum]|uniref:L,D-transpeptidase family protein n=1 Tax=Chloracidobacterium thermophilum TaxID=458033 RepID=UPI0007399E60|nr:L,D-transpeptidase [Chloracidobacterium thermophilum]
MGSIAIASGVTVHGLLAATRRLPVLLPFLLALLAESAALPPQTTPAPEAGERLRAAALQAGVPFPLRAVSLRVYKSLRRLELWSGHACVKAYAVALGAEPELDKLREGDHRTPVGRFYVCTRNDRSRFHLFLGLSYPNEEDAERGLRDGLISRRQYRAIRQAQRQQVRPPWNTPLGGEVGIHGGGTGSDWTWGCVALSNDDIEELWLTCPLKTPVTIYP